MLYYFDSSFLICIVQKEPDSEDAFNFWKKCKIRVSSYLLKIETNIVLRRNYAQRKNKVEPILFENQLADLNGLLGDVFFRRIDDVFEKDNIDYNLISKCKSLDAIHIATALDIRNNPNNSDICLCSFDKNMLALARQFGIETQGG